MRLAALENRIPPPIVALFCAGLMFGAHSFLPAINLSSFWGRSLAVLWVVIGLIIDGWALYAVVRAKTTINPLSPQNTTSLVVRGPYHFSRNPMYVGMVCYLIALVFYWASPLLIGGVALFVGYINRFQIKPEERTLHEKFGADFNRYCAQVRRWI